MKKTKKFKVIITPAMLPTERHKIEDAVKKMGYKVNGGGTDTDMSKCDFDFEK